MSYKGPVVTQGLTYLHTNSPINFLTWSLTYSHASLTYLLAGLLRLRNP